MCTVYYCYFTSMQALLAVGAIPGSVLGAWSSDRIGRRASLLAAGIVSLIGWLLIFIAQYTETATTFKVFLLLGRFMTGMSTGAFGSIVPVSVRNQNSLSLLRLCML